MAGERLAPGVGRVARLGERVGGGGPGALDQVDEPGAVAGAALVVGHELEHAVAGAADRVAEGEQLLGRRVGAGHEAVLRAVQDRAAGADAAGAGPQRLLGELRHLRDLVGVGLALVGTLAHHVGAQRGVRHLGGDVDGAGRLVERVEVLGKLSQSQSMPSWSAVPGMSSTPSMSSIRKSSPPGRTGANPTPQLPITTVVTPCQLEGVMSGSQVTWPS